MESPEKQIIDSIIAYKNKLHEQANALYKLASLGGENERVYTAKIETLAKVVADIEDIIYRGKEVTKIQTNIAMKKNQYNVKFETMLGGLIFKIESELHLTKEQVWEEFKKLFPFYIHIMKDNINEVEITKI